MKHLALAALLAAAAAPALAQSGTMYLSHHDPDGEVAPGQTVRFEMRIDWTGIDQLLWIEGNIFATPNIGSIPLTLPPSPGNPTWGGLHYPGTISGASIHAFGVGFTPHLYTAGIPIGAGSWPLVGTFITWDWTAPTVKQVTQVNFTFEPTLPPMGGVWASLDFYQPIPAFQLPITIVSAPILIDPANLHCPADLTTTAIPGQPGYGVPNNALESDDFFYYLTLFAAGDPKADRTHTAVFGAPGFGVGNGLVNNDDFFYYLALFAAGC